jgi:pimeloyl-ACP methyl ester carboxylesterase
MILIPGLQCSGAVWNEAVVFYSDKYQVHVLTIAGFAGEPAIPGLPLSTVRDDLIRYIRENKLNHPVIVGHSLGGFLALWIAATGRDMIDRIVSVDGVPFLPATHRAAAHGGRDAYGPPASRGTTPPGTATGDRGLVRGNSFRIDGLIAGLWFVSDGLR